MFYLTLYYDTRKHKIKMIVDYLFYVPLISNLTPTFSSQQSEVTTADVFSYKIITRHLPALGATASVELLSLMT